MLVSFEGQDGAGKTALLMAIHHELTNRGVPSVVVEEFSRSPYGQRLVEAVARDKFLRLVPGEPATVLSRALEIVADLYYQDEREISPALQQGTTVLKDRHLDTIIYALTPTLVRSLAVKTEERAVTWLSILCSELRHKPDLTVYVDAPLAVRVQRITGRARQMHEERANEISQEDIEVFAARERIVRRLVSEEPGRFVVFDNSYRPLAEGAQEIVEIIRTRLNTAVRKGRW